MKIIVATDSFKGSLSSIEAGEAIKEGILRAVDADVTVMPIADGGEGTVDALVSGLGGTFMVTKVTAPLGGTVDATWGLIDDGTTKTAVIEMAAAAGIVLLKRDELNPLHTTTYGVGELIRAAIDEGCRRFIIGIGGSATNDGGVGMLTALGYEFLDADNMPISQGAAGLKSLNAILCRNVSPKLSECDFYVACDVNNPLCGENGCSAVFGPQKGATPDMIKKMDKWLENYADLSGGNKNYPGSGAAGGMGFAFLTYLKASLCSGIKIVLEETKLEEQIKHADIVITGEGRMDSQTVMGKAPVGVAGIAKKYGKRVIAFCGCAADDAGVCNEYGIDAFFPILRTVMSEEEALDKKNAASNLTKTAEQVFRLIG